MTGNVLANDSDVDGETLTARLLTGPSHGVLVLRPDGSFTFIPENNWHGRDAFTYKAFDGLLATPSTATLIVSPVNDSPVAVTDVFDGQEDQAVEGNLLRNDGDIDGEPITAVLVSGPSTGVRLLNPDGAFQFIPAADWWGTDATNADDDGTSDNMMRPLLPLIVLEGFTGDSNGAFPTGSEAETESEQLEPLEQTGSWRPLEGGSSSDATYVTVGEDSAQPPRTPEELPVPKAPKRWRSRPTWNHPRKRRGGRPVPSPRVTSNFLGGTLPTCSARPRPSRPKLRIPSRWRPWRRSWRAPSASWATGWPCTPRPCGTISTR